MPAERDPAQTCGTCYYYVNGECRIGPPSVISYVDTTGDYPRPMAATHFPTPNKESWCGEWSETGEVEWVDDDTEPDADQPPAFPTFPPAAP